MAKKQKLHIHERVSAQAILRVAAREDVNRSLFADPEQEYNEAVQFYKHDDKEMEYLARAESGRPDLDRDHAFRGGL
jgi:hypothetical protein